MSGLGGLFTPWKPPYHNSDLPRPAELAKPPATIGSPLGGSAVHANVLALRRTTWRRFSVAAGESAHALDQTDQIAIWIGELRQRN